MPWFTRRHLAVIALTVIAHTSVLLLVLSAFIPLLAQDSSDEGAEVNQIFLPLVTSVGEGTEQVILEPAATEITLERTDQIIVQYADTVQAAAVDHTAQVDALSEVAEVELAFVRDLADNAIVVKLSDWQDLAEVNTVIENILSLPEVEYAEPDLLMQPDLTPIDPYYFNHWHYFAPGGSSYGVNLPGAWDITIGSPSLVVAVIDTGILPHADLTGRTVAGYDFVTDSRMSNDGNGRDNNPTDPGDWITAAESGNAFFDGCGVRNSSWHGTHVAGTIAAHGNNNVGTVGINWQSKILPVRVLGKCGGYTSDIIDGIRWAAGVSVNDVPANPNRARVINLSLGSPGNCSIAYQNAVDAAVAAGAVVVASAGNNNTDAINYSPASCENVITVAATERMGNRAAYSNYGPRVEISAPGGDTSTIASNGILSTLNTGKTTPVADAYAFYQGTSMATPHVTGIVSLMLSANPNLVPSQVTGLLQNNVTPFPLGSSCTPANCGAGIINAAAVVSAARNQLDNPPSAFVKSVPSPSGTVPTASTGLAWSASVGAASYQYCLDSTNNNVCNSNWINAGNTTEVTVENLQIGVTYFWQVRATNSNGNTAANLGTWSSFTRIGALPAVFNKSSPRNGQPRVAVNTTLRWNASTGATRYEYCIDTTNDNSCDTTWQNTGTTRRVAISNLANRTSYYWMVRATNSAGTTDTNEGTWWQFTTR